MVRDMTVIDTRMWVKDLKLMCSFYQTVLLATLLDETETSCYLQIEEERIELILGTPTRQSIAIGFLEKESFEQVIKHIKKTQNIHTQFIQTTSQSLFQSKLVDPEDNIIKLFHYQLSIPTTVSET